MKALILASLLSASPSAPVSVASLEPGDEVKCIAPGGCIILTKRAMEQLINELASQAAKACAKPRNPT